MNANALLRPAYAMALAIALLAAGLAIAVHLFGLVFAGGPIVDLRL